MNERIRQLALQAKFYSFAAGELQSPFRDEEDISDLLEKFAQLIVRECIAQCEKNKDHEWLGSGSKLSAFNIKEHFGVE